MNLKIIVYCPYNKDSSFFAGHEVHYLNSYHFDRWDAFKMFPESWLCFFDADCEFDEELISKISVGASQFDSGIAYCGGYLSAPQSSSLTQCYNLICNTWLEAGLDIEEPRLLGGFFVVFSSKTLQSITFDKAPIWGAEDYQLAIKLKVLGLRIRFSDDLMVLHKPKSNLAWFIKRSWIQGKNRPLNVSTNFPFWIKTCLKLNFKFIFLMLIHAGSVCFGRFYISLNQSQIYRSLQVRIQSLLRLPGQY